MRDSGDDLEGDWCTIVEYDGTVAEENMEQDSSQSSPQFPPAPSQPLSSLPSSQTQGQGKKKEKNKFFDDIMSSAKSKLMDQFYNVYSRYPETPPTFKKDEIFCLGKSFSPSFYPPERSPDTGQYPHTSLFLDYVRRSFFWFTYRKDFTSIPCYNSTSDIGWGCMIRTGQMMLARALVLHMLSDDWQVTLADKRAPFSTYRNILRLFSDSNSSRCTFSIHNLIKVNLELYGETEQKDLTYGGEWFSPSKIANVLNRIIGKDHPEGLNMYVPNDGVIYVDRVNDKGTEFFFDSNIITATTSSTPMDLISNSASTILSGFFTIFDDGDTNSVYSKPKKDVTEKKPLNPQKAVVASTTIPKIVSVPQLNIRKDTTHRTGEYQATVPSENFPMTISSERAQSSKTTGPLASRTVSRGVDGKKPVVEGNKALQAKTTVIEAKKRNPLDPEPPSSHFRDPSSLKLPLRPPPSSGHTPFDAFPSLSNPLDPKVSLPPEWDHPHPIPNEPKYESFEPVYIESYHITKQPKPENPKEMEKPTPAPLKGEQKEKEKDSGWWDEVPSSGPPLSGMDKKEGKEATKHEEMSSTNAPSDPLPSPKSTSSQIPSAPSKPKSLSKSQSAQVPPLITKSATSKSQQNSQNKIDTSGTDQDKWNPLIILIPARIGIDKPNPIYMDHLKFILKSKHSIGIIGGKPRASLYFIGIQDKDIIYMDPHFVQSALPFDAKLDAKYLETYHCKVPQKMPINHIDPSMGIGFYFKTREDFFDFVRSHKEFEDEGHPTIFTISFRTPTDYSKPNDTVNRISSLSSLVNF